MYILGLSSSWGTSRIRPAWSPFEYQLTPALSPMRGPRPKPHRPEEVVYTLNDSCSHFTQHLFPPKLPRQHTRTIFITHSPSFMLIIHHIQTSIYILLLHNKSLFHFFSSSWQAGCPRSLVSDTQWWALKRWKCRFTFNAILFFDKSIVALHLSKLSPLISSYQWFCQNLVRWFYRSDKCFDTKSVNFIVAINFSKLIVAINLSKLSRLILL